MMARKSVSKRGGKARARHYPGLTTTWAKNAARQRWNVKRAREGRPLLPLLPVPLVMTERVIALRERRELQRRRREYDRAHGATT